MNGWFSTSEVAKMSGARPTLLKRWCDANVVRPSCGGGIQGSHFRWSPLDLLRASVCMRMKVLGGTEDALRFAASLVESWPETDCIIAIEADRAVRRGRMVSQRDIVSLLGSDGTYVFIDIGRIAVRIAALPMRPNMERVCDCPLVEGGESPMLAYTGPWKVPDTAEKD